MLSCNICTIYLAIYLNKFGKVSFVVLFCSYCCLWLNRMAKLLSQMNRGQIRRFLHGKPVPLWPQNRLSPPKLHHQTFCNTTRPALNKARNLGAQGTFQGTLIVNIRGGNVLTAIVRTNHCRHIHLTSRKDIGFPPLLWIIVSFSSKAIAVITGR